MPLSNFLARSPNGCFPTNLFAVPYSSKHHQLSSPRKGLILFQLYLIWGPIWWVVLVGGLHVVKSGRERKWTLVERGRLDKRPIFKRRTKSDLHFECRVNSRFCIKCMKHFSCSFFCACTHCHYVAVSFSGLPSQDPGVLVKKRKNDGGLLNPDTSKNDGHIHPPWNNATFLGHESSQKQDKQFQFKFHKKKGMLRVYWMVIKKVDSHQLVANVLSSQMSGRFGGLMERSWTIQHGKCPFLLSLDT